MITCGIVSEFNPFHRGHRELIRQIRDKFSDRVGIVTVMSASFTQRGEPALYDTSHRVRAALREGIDLVIEIPVNFVLDSAESFATAGIQLLQASGVVQNLAYGSEDSESPQVLKEVAAFLVDENSEFKSLLDQNIRLGMGFAAARQAALSDCMESKAAGELLAHSNSILAVEYEKSIIKSASPLESYPLALYRKDKFSANRIRELVAEACAVNPEHTKGELLRTLHPYMTATSLAELILAYQKGEAPVFLSDFAPLIYSQKIWRDRESLKEIQGMQGGLADRFINQLRKLDVTLSSANFYDFLDSIATRTFPLSRVRRAFLSAILAIRREDSFNSEVSFLRILGFSKRGRTLLRYMKDCATLPVITRSADWRQVNGDRALLQMEQCFAAGNLWKSRLRESHKPEETRQIVQI